MFVPRPDSHMNFQTRFGLPVRDMYSKQRFATPPDTPRLAVPPRGDSGSLGESAEVAEALAAESVQNGPFSGATAENDVASEAQHAPGPAGPGASQNALFSNVSEQRDTPRIGKPGHLQKSYGGPNYENGLWLANGKHFR